MTEVHTHVHSSISHSVQEVATVSSNACQDKGNVECNAISLSLKQEGNSDVCHDIDHL